MLLHTPPPVALFGTSYFNNLKDQGCKSEQRSKQEANFCKCHICSLHAAGLPHRLYARKSKALKMNAEDLVASS
jgi:hypothetical protein